MRNVDQRFFCSVGQSRGGLDVFSEIMRMRIDREKIDVDGQRELIGDQEIFLAGRDVEFGSRSQVGSAWATWSRAAE